MDTLVDQKRLPSWLSAEDFKYYVGEFTRNGLTGPLNWYRNLDTNWALMEAYDGAKIAHPTLFIAGEVDPVLRSTKANFERLTSTVPSLVKTVIIPNAGHWVQQERPTEVNAELIALFEAGAQIGSSASPSPGRRSLRRGTSPRRPSWGKGASASDAARSTLPKAAVRERLMLDRA